MLEPQEINRLAVKIAKILEAETQSQDVASLFARLEKTNYRLDKLEHAMLDRDGVHTQIQHSSLDRFSVSETVADEILSEFKNEKACQFEPDKPCDHCSMCSSRGF
ncbi:hypothetical protein [Persicitalea sp.]|uniref:hypothetical protein n=1 Tax=Persicitalea sp. TaxID=3100273 RepID=UPI0035931B0B